MRIFWAGMLAALVSWGFRVEAPVQALAAPPEPELDGGATKARKGRAKADAGCDDPILKADYEAHCIDNGDRESCCYGGCVYKSCGTQACVNDNCFPRCEGGADCNSTLTCKSGICLLPGCHSNDDCEPDSGLVCREDFGFCVPPIQQEGDPPSCAAVSVGAEGGALLAALLAVALAAARARRRARF